MPSGRAWTESNGLTSTDREEDEIASLEIQPEVNDCECAFVRNRLDRIKKMHWNKKVFELAEVRVFIDDLKLTMPKDRKINDRLLSGW